MLHVLDFFYGTTLTITHRFVVTNIGFTYIILSAIFNNNNFTRIFNKSKLNGIKFCSILVQNNFCSMIYVYSHLLFNKILRFMITTHVILISLCSRHYRIFPCASLFDIYFPIPLPFYFIFVAVYYFCHCFMNNIFCFLSILVSHTVSLFMQINYHPLSIPFMITSFLPVVYGLFSTNLIRRFFNKNRW